MAILKKLRSSKGPLAATFALPPFLRKSQAEDWSFTTSDATFLVCRSTFTAVLLVLIQIGINKVYGMNTADLSSVAKHQALLVVVVGYCELF